MEQLWPTFSSGKCLSVPLVVALLWSPGSVWAYCHHTLTSFCQRTTRMFATSRRVSFFKNGPETKNRENQHLAVYPTDAEHSSRVKEWVFDEETKVQRELCRSKSCTMTTSQPCSTVPIKLSEHVAGGSANQNKQCRAEVCARTVWRVLVWDAGPLWASGGSRVYALLLNATAGKLRHSRISLAGKAWKSPCDISTVSQVVTDAEKFPSRPCSYCKYCTCRGGFARNSGHFGQLFQDLQQRKIPRAPLAVPAMANLLDFCQKYSSLLL